MDNHNGDRYTVAEERRVVYVTSTAPGTTMVGHLDVTRVGGSEKRRDHVATSPSSTACTDINELRAREHRPDDPLDARARRDADQCASE